MNLNFKIEFMKNIRQSNCLKFVALSIFFVFLFTNVYGQIKKNKPTEKSVRQTEQTSFSSEGKISNAVKLPPDVFQKLAEYDDGQLEKCKQNEFLRQSNDTNYFAASKINLDGDRQTDLIVQAQTPCFMGANNTTFWIFTGNVQKSASAYALVFDVAADFLKILRTSTKGFRDIETASHTAVELYTIRWKFDGQKYKQSQCTVTDEYDKVTKVKCNP